MGRKDSEAKLKLPHSVLQFSRKCEELTLHSHRKSRSCDGTISVHVKYILYLLYIQREQKYLFAKLSRQIIMHKTKSAIANNSTMIFIDDTLALCDEHRIKAWYHMMLVSSCKYFITNQIYFIAILSLY